jgi:hypothetical protein
LKFKNCKGAIFHNADWIAGVDYDENIQQDKDDNEAYDDDGNEDPKDKDEQNINKAKYNQIDEDKLQNLFEDTRKDDNHNQHLQEDEVDGNKEAKEDNEDEGTAMILEQESDLQGRKLRRSTSKSQPVLGLKPSMQDNKKKRIVSFAKDKLRQLEYCHNLVLQVKLDKEQTSEYGSNHRQG